MKFSTLEDFNANNLCEPERTDLPLNKNMVFLGLDYLEMDDIRVYPKKIHFQNPFEGKQFEGQITIINCGNKSAFIRILQPSSLNITMNHLKRGRNIPAGLSITRKIKYVVSMATLVPTMLIPIYINNNLLNYRIEIKLSTIAFNVEPKGIDFGVIDAGPTISRRKIKLTNIGGKTGRFSIDLGQNKFNMIVDPLQGILSAKGSIMIDIEINMYTEGRFETELWIISDNPICVKIFGDVVIGKIEAISKFSTKNFTFIHFPCTYYGLKSVESLLVRNKSQIPSLFCVTGEVDLESVPWDTKNPVFKYFNIQPLEGRLHPNDVRPFTLTFSPQRKFVEYNTKPEFILAIIQINKLYCKDLHKNLHDENIFDNRRNTSFKEDHDNSTQSLKSELTDSSFIDDYFQQESSIEVTEEPPKVETYFESKVRVILYGIPEQASITVRPDELILNNLILKQTEKRVLSLTNNSKNLPIYFQYQKVAFVEIIPKKGYLDIGESKEVEVLVTAHSYDRQESIIKLNLLYYDNPNLDNILKVIGSCQIPIKMQQKIISKEIIHGITFETFDFKKPFCKPKKAVLEILKKENALLALPNDRAGSLRVWKSAKVCRTLYAGIPRIGNVQDDYELSYAEINSIKNTRDYYKHFIRDQAEKLRNKLNSKDPGNQLENYDVSLSKEYCKMYFDSKIISHKPNSFIPLTPSQLFNIKIIPRNIVIDNIVPFSSFYNTLTIINSNDISVRIFLKAQKRQYFNFFDGNRVIVKPHSSSDITYICHSHHVGVQNCSLDVIVNEEFIFETSMKVFVKPKMLEIEPNVLNLDSTDRDFKFIEFKNIYNAVVEFKWDYVSDFKVFPSEGMVLPGKSLICMLYYDSKKLTANNYELIVIMGNLRNKYIRVNLDMNESRMVITDKIHVGNIPSSITYIQDVVFKNENNLWVQFEVNPSELEVGFSVSPLTGVIPPKCLQKITLEINSEKYGNIKSKIKIKTGLLKEVYTISIIGNITFPKLIHTPETIRFRKIAASSYDCKSFTVKNIDKITAKICFDTDRYAEIAYSEYPNKNLIQENHAIYIEPNKEKTFLIHHYPLNPLITSFHIPMIINNLSTYDLKSKIFTGKPPTKLYLAVQTHKILIKSWKYDFKFFPYYNYKSTNRHKLTITNPSLQNELIFCIRIDELQNPYSLNHISGGQIVYYDFSIVVELDPEEKVIFEALFNPDTPGLYNMKMPLFIQDDIADEPHNFLRFNGEYFEPSFSSESSCIYFGFLPLSIKVSTSLHINMLYHKPDCQIDILNKELCLQVSNSHPETKLNNVTTLYFEYSCKDHHLLDTTVTLKCTCDAKINILCYGSVIDCYLTTHAYIKYYQIIRNQSTTSLFVPLEQGSSKSSVVPSNTDLLRSLRKQSNISIVIENSLPIFPDSKTPFGEYMEEVVQTMENWMYEQAFYGKAYHKIPDNMVIYEIQEQRPDKDRAKHDKNILLKIAVLPVHKLLLNICGTVVNKVVSNIIEGELVFSVWLTNYYQSLKDFLTNLGGLLSHIPPEEFLDYENYKKYKVATDDSENIIPRERFYLISKLAWLDLLIQIYKILVFKRLLENNIMSSNNRLHKVVGYSSFYSDEEKCLLSWLDDNLTQQKALLTNKASSSSIDFIDELNLKKITQFNKDLSDSLVFFAVTVNYCPYLLKYLKNIYIPPVSREEYFHNACSLIRVWKMLRMSFTLTPYDIIDNNAVKMILFSAYLYDFMENIRPKETINFVGYLSEISKESIKITNDHTEALYYEVIFFENEEGILSAENNSVTILPSQTAKIEIAYFAKYVKLHEAYLILCGEIYGHKYSQSQTYILKTKPIIKNPFVELTVSVVPYVLKQYKVTVQSPYKQKVSYSLHSCLDRIPLCTSKWIPINILLKHWEMSRITGTSFQLDTDDNGVGVIIANIFTITNNTVHVWVLCKNETAGDFLVKFTMQSKPSAQFSEINLTFNATFLLSKCSCPGGVPNFRNNKCSKIINVPIPSRNEFIWSSIMDRILTCTDECERYFWSTYQGTTVGVHVLKRNLYDNRAKISPDMQYIFKENIVYNIKIKTNNVVGERQITINDPGSANEITNLKLHINSHLVTLVNIELKSVDGQETRLYKIYLNFDCSRPSVQEC